MWFSALNLAVKAGSHIFKKRQETKMLMADAQMEHARKMARGEEAYQGKLLEARQSDWKDEAVLDNFVNSRVNFGVGSGIGRSNSDGQGKIVL